MALDAAGTPAVTKYYSIAGQQVAMHDGTDLQFILTDHLGSVSTILDDVGGVISQQRYMPFGQARLDPGVSETDFGYTGQRALNNVGLIDFKARWFGGNGIGFLQADPIGMNLNNPQSLNRYTYVLNNPINLVDPTGFVPECIDTFDCKNLKPGQDHIPGGGLDLSELSSVKGGVSGISGEDFYNWYLELWFDKSGWWWDEFARDGDFTAFDAIAIILIGEVNNNYGVDHFAEAFIRAANQACPGACSPTGYINWFARYSKTAGAWLGVEDPHLLNPLSGIGRVETYNASARDWLNGISHAISDHPSEWNSGCGSGISSSSGYNSPCGWGNNSSNLIGSYVVRKMLWQSRNGALFVYIPNYASSSFTDTGNPFFIPSGCVAWYWLDIHHRNLSHECPDTP